MILFARLDPGDWLTRLALSALLQVTVVLLMATAVAGVVLRRRAAARHNLWLGALIWVLLSPAVAAVSNHTALSLRVVRLPLLHPHGAVAVDRIVPSPSPLVMAVTAIGGVATGPVVEHRHASRAVRPTRAERYTRREIIAGGACAVWALGLLIGLGRVAAGWRRLAVLTRGARPIDEVRHGATLEQVRAALGGAALPPIATSVAAVGPCAIGLTRPCVVLPEGLAEVLLADALRDVLVHECAHVLRHDTRTGLLQRLAGALYWPHPLVHYLNGQLSRAREEVCDNHVLESGDACGYARTLVTLTELYRPLGRVRAGLGILGARWTLAKRVAGLLDPGRIAMTRTCLRTKIALAAALAAAALIAATIRLDGPARGDEPAKPQGSEAAVPETPRTGTGRVTGLVVDAQGKPVAGAVVRPLQTMATPTGKPTAADGTFTLTFDSPIGGIGGLLAEVDGGARMGLVRYDSLRGVRLLEPARIVVQPSHRVTVRVHDAAGAPLPGAVVIAIELLKYHLEAQTGADGTALLCVPSDAKIPWVIAYKPGVGCDYFENYRAWRAPDFPPLPAEVSLVADAPETVRIKAMNSQGQPVSALTFGPEILLNPGKIHAAYVPLGAMTASTDGNGIALFDWLPRGAWKTTFRLWPETVYCPEQPLYQGPGPAELTARVVNKTRLTGTVRFRDGRPVSQIRIAAQGRGPSSERSIGTAWTGADGSYSLNLPPGLAYIVGVMDETWAAPSRTGVLVREGEPQHGLDFILGPGTLLRGRLTEEAGGAPVAGSDLILTQEGGRVPSALHGAFGLEQELERRASTDSDGRYHFRVGPGRYTLRGTRRDIGAQAIDVRDEPEIVRDFTLATVRRAFFDGLVMESTPAGDRPVARARYQKMPLGTVMAWGATESTTDAQGQLRDTRGPHEIIVYAQADGGERAGFAHLPVGRDKVTVMVAEAARITGRVIDAGGRPQALQPVRVRLDLGPDYARAGHLDLTLRTDEKGRFLFQGAPRGTAGEVYAFHKKGGRFTGVRTMVRFDVRDLEPVELPDLTIPADEPAKQ
jgi:beta-lactamase regulating signal transducer with metallopeptidase domain